LSILNSGNLDFSQVRIFGVLQRFAVTYLLTASVAAFIELYWGGHPGEDQVKPKFIFKNTINCELKHKFIFNNKL